MIYLVTGTPGASKTLNSIKFVAESSQFKDRTIYYYGIKELDPSLGWIELSEEEVYKWYEFPSGSVFVFDEAYSHFPARHSGKQVPLHVEKLATHRHGGFDIVMICQKVSGQLDPFIRGLVGRHQHYARVMGTTIVNRFEWDVCQQNPDSSGVRRDANCTPLKIDKKYFGKYHSADQHTHKANLPRGRIAILVVSLLGSFYLIWSVFDDWGGGHKAEASSGPLAAVSIPKSTRPDYETMSYAELYTPEIKGLPWTAPAFREVTKPVTYPKPNCLRWTKTKTCRCYTQQATELAVSQDLCNMIVESGLFDPARPDKPQAARRAAGEEA